MASLVFFESIDKDWIPHSRGMFEVIFSALYELYLDKSKASTIRAELLPKVQGHLYHCWPDKYEEPGGIGLDFVEFSRFPLSERAEVSRATLNLLHDFLYDRIDPH